MITLTSDPFEETLAFHCAPVLLGAKSANLVSFSKKEHPELVSKLREYSRILNGRSLCFEPVCECGSRVLVLVYRKALLMEELEAPGVASFLEENGYPWVSVSRDHPHKRTDLSSVTDSQSAHSGWQAGDEQLVRLLNHLKMRMVSCDGFPHEIGLFLGYPLPDVLGFINNQGQNYLLSGYWKVYSDAEQRKKTFARFTACRNYLCKHILNGNRLISALSAA